MLVLLSQKDRNYHKRLKHTVRMKNNEKCAFSDPMTIRSIMIIILFLWDKGQNLFVTLSIILGLSGFLFHTFGNAQCGALNTSLCICVYLLYIR